MALEPCAELNDEVKVKSVLATATLDHDVMGEFLQSYHLHKTFKVGHGLEDLSTNPEVQMHSE